MNPNYPSRKDIARKQKAETDWIESKKVYAECPDQSALAINYIEILDVNIPSGKKIQRETAARKKGLLGDHYTLLKQSSKFPSIGTQEHILKLGWSIYKGNRVIAQLKKMGLIEISEAKCSSRKGGRPKKMILLKALGKKFLKNYEARQGK